jgi:hypothetical protein
MMHKDKNGQELKIGQTVLVPDPMPDDLWLHSFAGTVESLSTWASVVDGDGDCWDVDFKRLEII